MRKVRISVLSQKRDGTLVLHKGWREITEAQYQRDLRKRAPEAEALLLKPLTDSVARLMEEHRS